MSATVVVSELEKSYETPHGSVAALRSISLEIEGGHMYTLLGPSGCGKTTALRCIAGLELPDAGEISVAGRVLFSRQRKIDVATNERRLGLVFQSYALWPHMDVYQTVAFPLAVLPRARRPSPTDLRRRVERTLATVKLEGVLDRSATELSGGQQQRLALARALVMEPPLMLMDEPLSNLDAQLREEMRIELKRLQRELGITVLYVTHDQAEALAISNRVAVMREGAILQVGKPREIYERPASGFVAEFVGHSNLLRGRVERARRDGCLLVSSAQGAVAVESDLALPPGASVLISIRAEHVELRPRASLDGLPNGFPGEVRARAFRGDSIDHVVGVAGRELKVRTGASASFAPGVEVAVALPPRSCAVIPDD